MASNDDFWDDPDEFFSMYDRLVSKVRSLTEVGEMERHLMLDALYKARAQERAAAMLRVTATMPRNNRLRIEKRRAIALEILGIGNDPIWMTEKQKLEYFAAYVALTSQDGDYIPTREECVRAAAELTKKYNNSSVPVCITNLWRIAAEFQEYDWTSLRLPSNRDESVCDIDDPSDAAK